VIVLVAEVAKSLGNRFEPGSFGLMVERVVGIRAVDDLPEQDQSWIAREPVCFQDCLERAFLAVMAEVHVLDIVGNGVDGFCLLHALVGWDKNELGVLID